MPHAQAVETAQPQSPADPEGSDLREPASQSPKPASASLLTRREVLMFVSAAVSVGVITVALLMGRGARPTAAAGAAATPAAGAPASAPVRPAVDRAAAVRWSSEHQDQWVGNRRHTAAFEVAADDTVAIWLGRVRPILVVRCADKKTEAFVFTGSAIRIEPRTDDHTVTFGFDDGRETIERWPDSAEHDALFAPDGAAFASRVKQARTLRFGYTPHNAAPVVATFHVSGLGPLIEPVARDCGQDAKKPAH